MTVWKGVKTVKKLQGKGKGKEMPEVVVVKDSWIDPVWKYMEGRILSILNKHGIKGVPTLIHEQQIKVPYPSIATANSSTHFL